MKNYWLIGFPLAFVAGLFCMVLLHTAGLVQFSAVENTPASDRVADVAAINSIRDDVTPSDSASGHLVVEELQAQLQTLQDDVLVGFREREELHEQMRALREAVASQPFEEPFLPGADNEPSANAEESQNPNPRRGGFRGFGAPNSNEQYEGLISAGIDPTLAQNIKQRSDQWELARLELIDTAEREGWRGSDEFGEKMRDLRAQRVDVREELGDDAYDKYLYVSGEDNRVRVDNIISGSAASLAGMESGDIVVSYANLRIFTHRQLQRATRDGSRGESVPVVVLRDGQYININVPRGPLGVTLSGLRQEPFG